MKTTRYFILTLLMIIMGMGAKAQQRNVIIVPDQQMQRGTTQDLPIQIENTDEIVAAQFDLTLPEGFAANPVGTMSARSDGHSVAIRRIGTENRYRVVLYAAQNRPLRGQSGTVFTVPLNVSNALAEGSQHQPVISNAVLTLASGQNVLTGISNGMLTIAKLPDLKPTGITTNVSKAMPADHIVVSWLVENISDLPTGDGWKENISLVTTDNQHTCLLTTTYYNEPLAAKAQVSRQAEITLNQLLPIEGDCHVKVEIVPMSATGEPESSRGNNTAEQESVLNIGKIITLQLLPLNAVEGQTSTVTATISRSGLLTASPEYALNFTTDPRLPASGSVTFSFEEGHNTATAQIAVSDDELLNSRDTTIISVTAVVDTMQQSQTFKLIDNEQPQLTIQASPTEISEGESIQLTITTERASQWPVTVTLSSEDNQHFQYPASVVIPAGETSAIATVTTHDDELPGLDIANAFTATAPHHKQGQAIVIMHDNDMPALSLELTPTTVSESAGPVSVAATLRRTGVTTNKITVKLSDDSNGGIYYSNQTIVMDKNVSEATFNLGPIDNAQVEGDRTYTITAAVYISSCSCNATGESAGAVSAQLNIIDDDGAALTLTSQASNLMEGQTTTLTVTRNSVSDLPLTVTITSDGDDHLSYDHTVTIPAGQQSATVTVTALANDDANDSRTVIFTAQAEGYNAGTCYVMVTDQTLPDARITAITATPSEVEVGQAVQITLTLANTGFAGLPEMTKVHLYSNQQSDPLATMYLQAPLAANESTELSHTITMPMAVGTYNLYAIVNKDKTVQETSYSNNTSASIEVKTISPFNISIHADKSTYNQGETVNITGSVSGANKAHQTIEVYVINENYRHKFTVETDENGHFSTTYQPYEGQMGHFVLGACYPGEGLTKSMASFDFYGIKRTSYSAIECRGWLGETYQGSFSVINPGMLPLSGVKVHVVSAPENCQVTASVQPSVAKGETFKVSFTIDANAISEPDKWQEIELSLESNEGASLSATLYYYCQNNLGQITANVKDINTTVTKGTTRDYPFVITNIGKGETGEITISLPSWMKLATPSRLPSLAYGDSATVILRLQATDGMQLNVPWTGTLGVQCTNGNGLVLNYSVEAVSEEKGFLKVDVCDEYTYYTTEAPHVSNAQVTVRHPYSNEIITQGTTDGSGIFLSELPEGYYKLEVTADKHENYSNYCYINPGRTETVTVNISYQPITISWKVEETEVEDEYQIETVLTYETNVPMPVVKMEIPKSIDGDNMAVGDATIITMALTNIGLINAENTEVVLPTNMTEWKFEALSHTEPFTLAPQQSVFIPIRITRIADVMQQGNSRRFKNAARTMRNVYGDCMAGLGERYKYLCGKDLKTNEAAERLAMKTCAYAATGAAILDALSQIFKHGYTPNPSKPGTPHKDKDGKGDDDPGKTIENSVTKTLDICDPCDAARAEKLIDTLLGFTWLDMINGGISKAIEEYQKKRKDAGSLRFVVKEIGGKVVKEGGMEVLDHFVKHGKTVAGYTIEIYEMATVCKDINKDSSRRKAPRKASNRSWIDEFDNAAADYVNQLRAIDQILLYAYGDRIWYDELDEGKATFINYISSLPDDYIPTDDELLAHKPESTTLEQARAYVNHIYGNSETFPTQEQIEEQFDIFEQQNEQAKAKGYTSMTDLFSNAYESYQAHFDEMKANSVCASITLKLSQHMALTRQAFRGTLSVFNGHETDAMENVRLNLEVKNTATGEIATSHEFQINMESLKGFAGQADLTSGWSLDAQATGDATILFIPTKYAASEEGQSYSFGGTLTYIDPFTGLEVIRELYPVTLTVKPTAELDLEYFMQRDIYGDDPLTADVVEPMKPAEFALVINNKGYGEATNVRMQTRQPEIIDNEKGLAVNFDIVSSQVNGQSANLSFSQTIANDFGTIPAHSQAYAQWWLQSSLLGHFTSYDVTVNHLTSYGNEDLSLIDQANIHELIHGFTVKNDSETPVRGFLTNDENDAQDMPDNVYFTDANHQPLYIATNAQIQKQSNTEYLLTITPSQNGWNYGSLTDPTLGKQEIISIVRQSDGAQIATDNIWQTDRTLLDGKDWLYENHLHFVANMGTEEESFLITFEPRPEKELEVEGFSGLPDEGTILEGQLMEVTVRFNKDIDPETFTTDDLALACQGKKLDVSGIIITQVSSREFLLNLSALTAADGYYVLTVQTAGISDSEGFTGATGKSADWTQFNAVWVFLDEEATTINTNETSGAIQLVRTMKENQWNTVCLPFNMSQSEVEQCWGIGTRVASFTGTETDGGSDISLAFSIHKNGIMANSPCLVKPTTGISSISLTSRSITWVANPEVRAGEFSFKGIYVSGNVVPSGDYYLSNDKFYRSKGLSTMKGYRAWFHDNALNTSRSLRLRFDLDDEPTILLIPSSLQKQSPVYDLRGISRGHNQRGIIIEDNKKKLKK